MVVSSVTPLMPCADLGPALRRPPRASAAAASGRPANSSDSAEAGSGTAPAASYSAPLWTSIVASPPSSRIMFGPVAVRPRQRLLGAPPVLLERLALPGEDRDALRILGRAVGPTTTAAAAWSWVEKMLHEHQRTSAPSAASVSISTAVWIVMCSEPDDARALQRLRVGVLRAGLHQAGHLVLGEHDLLAAELGQREVGDLEVRARCGGGGRSSWSPCGWACVVVGVRWRRPAAAGACPAPSAASRLGGTSLGRARLASNHASTAARELRRRGAGVREADLAEADVVARRAARAACAGAAAHRGRRGGSPTPSGGARCSPALLDVAQHARRPARGLRSLVDRQRVHDAATLPRSCQGFAAR